MHGQRAGLLRGRSKKISAQGGSRGDSAGEQVVQESEGQDSIRVMMSAPSGQPQARGCGEEAWKMRPGCMRQGSSEGWVCAIWVIKTHRAVKAAATAVRRDPLVQAEDESMSGRRCHRLLIPYRSPGLPSVFSVMEVHSDGSFFRESLWYTEADIRLRKATKSLPTPDNVKMQPTRHKASQLTLLWRDVLKRRSRSVYMFTSVVGEAHIERSSVSSLRAISRLNVPETDGALTVRM
ncbi:hypothetical protein SISNIDRAFT_471267 [Sistotremastrum niveocremeum HHB9708]|uniref:Uncharacterized protein n=1 Tax=Sistotremastrum niveocremeum HHB9708 TaxID=1314777 RepID=A0A164MW10_9AGAM|nr:hypothetical protein SISNIDRAFT_471267 [Sistotremastrum niveocremeum HHB9708]